MAKDWLITRKPAPRSYYKPAPKPEKKKPPIIKPGERRPNQYTDTGGENVPTFYNPTPASAPAKKVLAQPVVQTPPTIPDYSGPSGFRFGSGGNMIEQSGIPMPENNNTPPQKRSPRLPEFRKPRQNRPPSYDPSTIRAWLEMQKKPLSEMTSEELYMYANMYDDPIRGLEGINTKYQEWYSQQKFPVQVPDENYMDHIDFDSFSFGSLPTTKSQTSMPYQSLSFSPPPEPTDTLDLDTAFGQRGLVDRNNTLQNVETTGSDYWSKPLESKLEEVKRIQEMQTIKDAVNRAAPVFTPLLDENGEVLAPALMTPDEYIKGLEEQTIFDPLLPDSKFQFGKTQLVYQDGKIMPAEEWYRTVGDHLIGGNWELPEFTDQGGYQYNSRTHWDNPSMAIGIENKALQNAMNDARITGNQFINPNFYPHINYQLYDQVVVDNEQVEDSYGEGDGDYGYGYGDGYGYGYGYGGGSYGPGYYTDAYRQDKGQYYSQLARWVI